jgi:hypothetical protein
LERRYRKLRKFVRPCGWEDWEHQLRQDPSTTRYAATIWRRGRHELPLCVAAFAHANFQVASSSAAHTPATDVHGSVGCRIPTFICARFSLPGATIISNAITNFLGALCVAIHFLRRVVACLFCYRPVHYALKSVGFGAGTAYFHAQRTPNAASKPSTRPPRAPNSK